MKFWLEIGLFIIVFNLLNSVICSKTKPWIQILLRYHEYQQQQKQPTDNEDILQFQSCRERNCSSEFNLVLNNFMLAMEYSGVIDCMKYQEECLKVENPETGEEFNQINQMHRCFQFCFNLKQFSKEIENLNKCNLSCVESTIEDIEKRNQSNFDYYTDAFYVKRIFFSTLVIFSIIFGIYCLCQRRKRNQIINQQLLFESHSIDLSSDQFKNKTIAATRELE